MAYHLSQEARAGLSEFYIPAEFAGKLLEFQKAAVQIAAHHLTKRGGVVIGDVVGLGKTLMATALAKLVQETQYISTLIICPKNLVRMWQGYVDEYGLQAKVLSLSMVERELADVPARFRLVLIDESHNLRNRSRRRYNAIREYIAQSNSKVILLSATPYNKTYLDLSNQLRLFVPEDADIGIRPERCIKEMGETEFIRRHQCPVRSLAAFEKSEHADDWRELMRLYLVRRTRSFIKENYGREDPVTGQKYLQFEDGRRCIFPVRVPKTLKFSIDETDRADQYARMYSPPVVDTINALNLPRYGMGNYVISAPRHPPTQAEADVLDDLSRAGKRLMGFCRTNLFKRLESSGQAFIQSIERHILRNYIFLHAIENDQPIPIGTQDMGLLDQWEEDDTDSFFGQDEDDGPDHAVDASGELRSEAEYRRRAASIYAEYTRQYATRFKWLRPGLFSDLLGKDLSEDAVALMDVLKNGSWNAATDAKLNALVNLLTKEHPNEKVLIFTQFADTVSYLERQLKTRGIRRIEGVSGKSADPTGAAWRFSPVSNNRRERISLSDELRVLVATDVLSEGQNLQDCSVIVNYDLPWAIIRLIQRAGRVDRIGQQAHRISCYSFLPADGVERIIRLRARVRTRLKQNAEVVGTDESFFEDDTGNQTIADLFTERAGLLDGEEDAEVDLASYALQIWKNAIERDPRLENLIPALPPVSYATRLFGADARRSAGALVYMRTSQDNDALAWIDMDGEAVTESQFEILKAAECAPSTPAQPRHDKHHALVRAAVELIGQEEKSIGGQLGRPSGARFRTYERLKHWVDCLKGTLYQSPPMLMKALDEIYRFPLSSFATDSLNRMLRSGASDEKLAEAVLLLREESRLCQITEDGEAPSNEPRIICSMGLVDVGEGNGHAA
jgi:superfamily II DNA or RNA helicase